MNPRTMVSLPLRTPGSVVNEADLKFRGITDSESHKIHTIERRKMADQELEKMQEEISKHIKPIELIEEAKQQIQMELESTKRLIEDLKLELEKAKKEEQQAKQESEVARLRVEEIKRWIEEMCSKGAKEQLEVAKAHNLSAVSELKSVREEIERVTNEYEILLKGKDLAAKKAEDAVMETKEMERTMEGLTEKLKATKESLESIRMSHLEAKRKRFSVEMSRNREILNWEEELKVVEDDIEKFNVEVHASEELKTKIETASSHLRNLRGELAGQVEKRAMVESMKKELEEVKLNIEKGKTEVKTLKIIAESLQSKLKKEKKDVENKDISSILQKGEHELSDIAVKLQRAMKEADESKSFAKVARDELKKAKKESDEAKTNIYTLQNKLTAAKKEIENARVSEKLALATIKALQESERAFRFKPEISSPRSVIVSVEEYYELTKKAHEAEEEANMRIAEIVSKIQIAKDQELKIFEKLEEVNRELVGRAENLKIAMEKSEEIREENSGAEHTLRKWRSENGKKRKGEEFKKRVKSNTERRNRKNEIDQFSDYIYDSKNLRKFDESGIDGSGDYETKKKKKKFSLFSKIFMFLARKTL